MEWFNFVPVKADFDRNPTKKGKRTAAREGKTRGGSGEKIGHDSRWLCFSVSNIWTVFLMKKNLEKEFWEINGRYIRGYRIKTKSSDRPGVWIQNLIRHFFPSRSPLPPHLSFTFYIHVFQFCVFILPCAYVVSICGPVLLKDPLSHPRLDIFFFFFDRFISHFYLLAPLKNKI